MENAIDPAQLLSRTAWLKALASCLTADESRADDIVQDTWLALLQEPPRDPRATVAWLRSVVRRLACRSHRGEARRGRRERVAAERREVPPGPEQVLERFDLHRRLVELVAGLDEPFRGTVLMRFFEELAPGEIARRQGVAVTTVRWRLSRALGTLRARLDRAHGGDRAAWRAALLPLTGLDPGLGAPGAAAITAAGAPIGSGSPGLLPVLATGGALMAKKLTLSFGLAAMVALAGVGVWRLAGPPGPGREQPLAGGAATSQEPDLAARLERARTELEDARARIDALSRDRQQLEDLLRERNAAAGPEPTAEDAAPRGAAAPSGIRWSEFGSLLTKSLDLLAKLQRKEPLTDQEQAQLSLLHAEVQKISAQAKLSHPFPALDLRFFRELTAALLQEPLGLTESQLAALQELNEEIFSGVPERPETLAPLEQYSLRREMLASFFKGVEGLLDEEQSSIWPVLRRYSGEVLNYGDSFDVGFSTQTSNFLVNWLTNALHGTPEPGIIEPLTPVAQAYFEEAQAVFERYVPEAGDAGSLPPEIRAKMESDLLRLQARFQDQVQPLLSEVERRKLQERPPLIIRFKRGQNVSIMGRWSPL